MNGVCQAMGTGQKLQSHGTTDNGDIIRIY